MAKFTVEHISNREVNKAFNELKDFLNRDEDLRRFDPKMECHFNESSKSATIKSSQFKAQVEIKDMDKGKSQVLVHVDLPMLLTPFKGKIQDLLQKKLAKYLA